MRSTRVLWSWRVHGPALGVLLAGFASSLVAAVVVRTRAVSDGRLGFERRAAQIESSARTSFEAPLEILLSIPALFDASDDVTRGEFRAFVRRALVRRPDVYGLEWFPRVAGSDRSAYEDAARRDGLLGYRFTQDAGVGKMVRSADRPEHLPLYYMEPPNDVAMGLDLASDPLRIAPALRARDLGSATASPRIRLVEDPPQVFSVAFFAPVYAGRGTPSAPDARRARFRGVAAAVFRVKPVVDRALGSLDLAGLEFLLLDASASGGAEPLLYETRAGLFGRFGSAPPTNRSSLTASLLAGVPFHATEAISRHDFSVADRKWRLIVWTPALIDNWAGIVPLVAGLLLSVLLAVAVAAAALIRTLNHQVRDALRLGQYTLGERLGEGGMGIVYMAHHALLRRPTAIKLLHREPDEQHLQRFEREAQLTSRLTHPHTISVYDYGRTPDGLLYYAMEYLEGLSFEQLVDLDGPQPSARVVHLLVQICGALDEAHRVGLIHRDIKPANLMLTRRGNIPDFVKVLDFGLAKPVVATTGAPDLSGARPVLGTPAYMSPEAILSESVDARSDLYALGAVAYYLTTGSVVFEGETIVVVCGQHLHSAVVPPSVRLDRPVPPAFERVILHCLEKKPVDRPASAAELRRELLACDVGRWDESDAERWWAERGEALVREIRDRGVPRPSDTPERTVAIDVQRRVVPE
jgi:serine/threonine-protein kinase